MRPLNLDEIIARDRYAELRVGYRDAIIAYKRGRRMALATTQPCCSNSPLWRANPNCSCLFQCSLTTAN